MSMRDDVLKGKTISGIFANDVEAHINNETTTLVFGETWVDGHTNILTKITIPTKVFATLGLSAFQVMNLVPSKEVPRSRQTMGQRIDTPKVKRGKRK